MDKRSRHRQRSDPGRRAKAKSADGFILQHYVDDERELQARDHAYATARIATELWGDGNEADAREGFRQALAIYPACIAAKALAVILHALSSNPADQQYLVAGLTRVLAEADAYLSPRFFEQHRGRFADDMEGGAYLMAMKTLSETLCEMERYADAVAVHERMMELEARFEGSVDRLLPLLGAGKLEAAAAMLEPFAQVADHPEDPGAEPPAGLGVFLWACVLERYLAGDLETAKRRLDQARVYGWHLEPVVRGDIGPDELDLLARGIEMDRAGQADEDDADEYDDDDDAIDQEIDDAFEDPELMDEDDVDEDDEHDEAAFDAMTQEVLDSLPLAERAKVNELIQRLEDPDAPAAEILGEIELIIVSVHGRPEEDDDDGEEESDADFHARAVAEMCMGDKLYGPAWRNNPQAREWVRAQVRE